MTYEIQREADTTTELLAEGLNEYLIDTVGIDTHDFLVIATADGRLEIKLDNTEEVDEQIDRYRSA